MSARWQPVLEGEVAVTVETTATLLVIAKEPRPGRVKTRLQTRFTPAQASELAAAALQDTLAVVLDATARRRVLVLDGSPGEWLPEGFEVLGQRGDGLDERLAAAFEDAAGLAGAGPMLLVGMDTPQLTPALLNVDWDGVDAVLGLSTDGGYWAIGLREPRADALLGVPMSTPHTGAAQLERLRSLGLRVRLLEALTDVDTPDDAGQVAAAAPGSRFAIAHQRMTGTDAGEVHPLALFEEALAGLPVMVHDEGYEQMLDVARWDGLPDEVDELMISRCEAPVLDVGCGPGRLVTAACERGLAALGVDVSASAVELTRRRGGSVLRRRVQDRLPGESRWGTVLLADGNIGIGGDPDAMLRRCRELLRPGGLLLVEADPDDHADACGTVVLRTLDGRASSPLPWARLGSHALAALLTRHDFSVIEEWRAANRVLLGARSLPAG